jgi:hypothetical protein
LKDLEVFMLHGVIASVADPIVEQIAPPILSSQDSLDEDLDFVGIDYQSLAEEIFRLIKRELMLENERRGL